jgi:hypothetical protein
MNSPLRGAKSWQLGDDTLLAFDLLPEMGEGALLALDRLLQQLLQLLDLLLLDSSFLLPQLLDPLFLLLHLLPVALYLLYLPSEILRLDLARLGLQLWAVEEQYRRGTRLLVQYDLRKGYPGLMALSVQESEEDGDIATVTLLDSGEKLQEITERARGHEVNSKSIEMIRQPTDEIIKDVMQGGGRDVLVPQHFLRLPDVTFGDLGPHEASEIVRLHML